MRTKMGSVGLVGFLLMTLSTALLWFPGSRQRGIERAMGDPGGGGGICLVGSCKKIVGQNGGCLAVECCGGDVTYCPGVLHSPVPVPKYKTPPAGVTGICVIFDGPNTNECLVQDCGGATLCSEGTCSPVGDQSYTQVPTATAHGGCLMAN